MDDKGAFGGDIGFRRLDSRGQTTRRKMLEREVRRHEGKLETARSRLAAIAGIPDKDPFTDGTVLAFERKVGNKTYTYAALRQNGTWWTTESTNKSSPRNWVSFTDWLVDGGTTQVIVMEPGVAFDLANLGGVKAEPPVCACVPGSVDPLVPDPFHTTDGQGVLVHEVCSSCQRDLASFPAPTAVSSDSHGGVDLFCRCSLRIGWSARGSLPRLTCGLVADHPPHYLWQLSRSLSNFGVPMRVPVWCIGQGVGGA